MAIEAGAAQQSADFRRRASLTMIGRVDFLDGDKLERKQNNDHGNPDMFKRLLHGSATH
jgi:hypothetical protein